MTAASDEARPDEARPDEAAPGSATDGAASEAAGHGRRRVDGTADGREPSAVLDLRGLKCPMPVLKTRRRLARMAAEEVLAVIANDPLAGIDIPHMCREDGHRLLDVSVPDARGTITFTIAKGTRPARD